MPPSTSSLENESLMTPIQTQRRTNAHRHRFALLRPALLATLTAAVVASLTLAARHAGAQPAASATINIPAQPLAQALAEFARQSGLQLVYAPDLVQGKHSAAVVDRTDAPAALSDLLRGSGLQARQVGSTWTIERAAAGAASDTVLPLVRVSASPERETASGPVAGYVAKRSATGTKTDTPIIETPRSISVITTEQLADQGAVGINEALRYTPGLVAEPRGGISGSNRSEINVRGFRSEDVIYRDGLKPTGRGFFTSAVTTIDSYGLERVEVLRGPASAVYGGGLPSGLVNGVTKRPQPEAFTELGVGVGTYERAEGMFDLNRPLDGAGNVLLRLTGVARASESHVELVDTGRTYVAPALTLKLLPDTTLTLLAQYQHSDGVDEIFYPASGTVLANPVGTISRKSFLGEPAFEKFDSEYSAAGYLLSHRFDDRLAVNQAVRYERWDVDRMSVFVSGMQADNRTLNRLAIGHVDNGHALATDTNAELKFHLGATQHLLLAGINYRRASVSRDLRRWDAPTIDAFEPVYGQPIVFTSPPPLFVDTDERVSQTGIYLQDQVRYGKWLLTVGGRHDRVASRLLDRRTSAVTRQDDDAATGQIGVMYQFDLGIAPYYNHATSFDPQTGTGFGGTPFKPTEGKQHEAGIKVQPKDSETLITLAAFDLRRQNVLTIDPANVGFSVQTGEVTSRGVELEAKSSVNRRLSLTAAYTHLRALVSRSNGADLGKRLPQVPRNSLSVWADYKLAGGALDGVSLGAGARYVGASPGDALNTFEAPSFTLFDLALRYDFSGRLKGTRFALNINNAFDKTYVASCSSAIGCFYGAPRTIMASVTHRF
jgi:iron complex outermembrane recepter protein